MLAKKKIIAAIVSVCVIGGSIVLMVKPKEDENIKQDKEHTAVVDDITVGVDGAGEAKLQGKEHKFSTNGTIEEIYVKKGQKIKKGDKIAKLSDKEINLELEEAKIDQKVKLDTLNQLKDQKKGESPDPTIDTQIKEAQGELDKINRKVNKLKADLGRLYVYAQRDGVVTEISGEVGSEITTSKAVAVIGDRESIYIDVMLGQTDIINVGENQEVKVRFEAYPDIEVSGFVEEKSYVSSGEGEDVDYKIRAKLDTKDLEVYQNMTAEVQFIIKEKKNVLQIPNKAITMKGNKQIVKVKENGEIKEVEVKTGFSDGKVTEIIEGLQEGQVVVEER